MTPAVGFQEDAMTSKWRGKRTGLPAVLMFLAAARARLIAALVAVASLGHLVNAQQDPSLTGTWAPGAVIGDVPPGSASAVLPDGGLVVSGGTAAAGTPIATIRAYDSLSGTWTIAGSLTTARSGHAMTALADGRLVIAGGIVSAGDPPIVTSEVEVFDPATGTSTPAGSLAAPRTSRAMATLHDGTVLVVGGSDGSWLATFAERYDPETGSSTPTVGSLLTPRSAASATALLRGQVLVAGGHDGAGDVATAEIYDPESQAFIQTSPLSAARSGHTALLLPLNNTVLISGGHSNDAGALKTTELFVPWADGGAGTFAVTGSMTRARVGGASGPQGAEGVALIVGGGSATSEHYHFATITTDAEDYPPGTTVVMTGSGFKPGEWVDLDLEEVPFTDQHSLQSVRADAQGRIVSTEFAPNMYDLGVRFYLTASGRESGWQAQTTFTDGWGLTGASFDTPITRTIVIPSSGNAQLLLGFRVFFSSDGPSATCSTGSLSHFWNGEAPGGVIPGYSSSPFQVPTTR